MTQPIIFYDIPSSKPKNSWSPNTWKIRYALNYKGLPYKTEWVEYPDIAPLVKKIGALPTDKHPDGSDYYTLPAIYDPNTKTAISDSAPIAKYLDENYPDTVKVFPPGTDAFQEAFLSLVMEKFTTPAYFILMARTGRGLNPVSGAMFNKGRKAIFGDDLDAMNTPQAWADLEKGVAQIKSFIDANGAGKPLTLLGEQNKFTFSDFHVAASLMWFKVIAGEDSEDWKRVAGWSDGFAEKYLAQLEKLETIDA